MRVYGQRYQGKTELVLGAVSCRLNVIAANTTSDMINIIFAGDTSGRILSALRSLTTSSLPKLKLVVTYKSLSGASYALEHMYLLDIREDSDEQGTILKNWHTTITAAPVEEKEAIEILRKIPSGEKTGVCGDRSDRRDCFHPDPGYRIRLDGCTFYLYLPAGSRTGSDYVFLGMW